MSFPMLKSGAVIPGLLSRRNVALRLNSIRAKGVRMWVFLAPKKVVSPNLKSRISGWWQRVFCLRRAGLYDLTSSTVPGVIPAIYVNGLWLAFIPLIFPHEAHQKAPETVCSTSQTP